MAGKPKPSGYDRHKEAARARQAEASASGRDIGSIPALTKKSIRRRAKCEHSLKLFCETYNPRTFYLGWSKDQLEAIARIEEAVLYGALYALAMPRGSGKTALCRMGAVWGTSYRRRRYASLIGSTSDKAEDSLDAIKTVIRFLGDYAADFPEISYPVKMLGGIANRARGQLCRGEPTQIEWSKDRVILPTVPPPKGWPKAWGLRDDGMVPTSGSIIGATGLTGEGIRGSVVMLTNGESVRPDLVLLDDPQTHESARSLSQNNDREQLVSADVLGMAGPGETISCVMPCTVIAPGDMADRLLDRTKHPLWRGHRTRMLESMPSDLAAWDPYFEVYKRCALKEPPDFAEANAYYITHREQLDAGAVASWEERKGPGDVSAIQHAMHLYCRDKRAFFAEYQNDPLPLIESDALNLDADAIAARINRVGRGLVPTGLHQLTAFIDVQKDLLYWTVCGWGEGFAGAVIDYGAFPDQRRTYFDLSDARPTLSQAVGISSLEGSLWEGLTRLADQILGVEWLAAGGGVYRVERCMIDAGWGNASDTIKKWIRQSKFSTILLPSFGKGITAGKSPIANWPKHEGERRGLNWIVPPPRSGEARYLLFDANFWKTFVADRLSQPMGERGAMSLFGDNPELHRLIADQCCSEKRTRTSGGGREVDEWSHPPPKSDNHLWDCLVGSAVAASFAGVVPLNHGPPPVRKTVSFAQMQAEQRGRKSNADR